MNALYLIYYDLLARTNTKFVRYLHQQINWNSRLTAVLGSRGVGKTTMMLQHIKLCGEKDISLYIAADHIYFSSHTLYDTADTFCKNGGRHLYIDEVHKYPGWSREVKMMYDYLPDLTITISGSSMLDLGKGLEADLSRRALWYILEGMSFREYINFSQGTDIPAYTIDQILAGEVDIKEMAAHPLPLFSDYLRHGYYPFFKADDYLTRLDNAVIQTLESDIPQFARMNIASARKLKKLMYVVVQSTPFKPNYSNIGRTIEVDRATAADYLVYMEKAGLARLLCASADGCDAFAKAEKVYLNNTNLAFSQTDGQPDKGTLRETFFFSNMSVRNKVTASPTADFEIDGHTFEVGGRNKTGKQLKGLADAFIVKDDIEYAVQHTIPLWMFGFNY